MVDNSATKGVEVGSTNQLRANWNKSWVYQIKYILPRPYDSTIIQIINSAAEWMQTVAGQNNEEQIVLAKIIE